MSRRTALPLLAAASALALMAAAPAHAQGYYDRPVYGAPSYQDGYEVAPQPRARVQRQLPPNLYPDPAYADQDPYELPSAAPRGRTRLAALPPDADPAYSSRGNYDLEIDTAEATREVVADPTGRPRGTITINTGLRKLYLSLGNGQAIEYGIGVGREGFLWKGSAQIGRKAVWPGWTPPSEMLKRRPDLPRHMEGGLDNPLGARALYLFKGSKDTLFRIHGTNEPDTIGQAVSSGCIRMLNADVMDLYQRVSKGATVVVI
jgi:lipoprotein-anchoring transpeptidase ErfK/SrfK